MNSRVHLHVTIDRSTGSRAADVGSFFMGFAEMKKIKIKCFISFNFIKHRFG